MRARRFLASPRPLLGALAVASLAGCFGAPAHEGPQTPHFEGGRFYNDPRVTMPDAWDLFAWQLEIPNRAIPWREAPPITPVRPPPKVESGIRVTFVNHATVLVQMDGVAILTDPIWAERVGPVSFAGPSRQLDPGVRLDDLPKIDAVVISHSHYDHCDVVALKTLADRFGMPIFAGLGSAAMLSDHDVGGGKDLDWWKSAAIGSGVTVTMTPAQHGSQRGVGDRDLVLWGGYYFKGKSGTVFFAGDTALGLDFAAIQQKLGPPTVALLPIGAYRPRWFMKSMHMDPPDAVQAHLALGARRSVGIHWGTFDLADEGRFQPAGELGLAIRQSKLPPDAFVAARNGDVFVYGVP